MGEHGVEFIIVRGVTRYVGIPVNKSGIILNNRLEINACTGRSNIICFEALFFFRKGPVENIIVDRYYFEPVIVCFIDKAGKVILDGRILTCREKIDAVDSVIYAFKDFFSVVFTNDNRYNMVDRKAKA